MKLLNAIATTIVMAVLSACTTGVIYLMREIPLKDSVLQFHSANTNVTLALLVGLAIASVVATHKARDTHNTVLWFVGLVTIFVLYAISGTIITQDISSPMFTQYLKYVTLTFSGTIPAVLFVGLVSDYSFDQFQFWGVFLLPPAGVISIGGLWVPELFYITGVLLVVSVLFYLLFLTGRFSHKVSRPVEDGARLYVAVVLLPLEIATYLFKQLL